MADPQKSILVVDDHPLNRQLLVGMMTRAGYRALEANDGAQALSIVRKEVPDLVISDILMPTVDGFEFVRQLRIDPAVAHTKVIFCTATYHEHEAGELARIAGVIRVLSKPCKPSVLLQAVEEAIALDAADAPAGLNTTFDRAHLQLMTDKLSAQEAALLRAQRVARLAHVVSRSDGTFESWSETLRELTGLDDEHLPRSTRAWLDLVHPADQATLRAHTLQASRLETRAEVEYLLHHAGGSWINIFHVIEPVAEASPGKVTRWFSTLQDVTARVQAQEEVRRLNTDLERRVAERTLELHAAMKELESFDYSISHDLRAPVNRILGFAEMLANDHAQHLDDDGRDLVKRIVNSAEHIDQLVRDLFSLSTVSRGELRRAVVDVTALVQSINTGLAGAQPARAVVLEVAPGLEAWADPGLTRIVLENLLGNAWKFTRKREGARIEVGCVTADQGPGFYVRDNGAGFDSAKASKLFAPFQRLHSSTDFEGTGIGLATVSRIVARHGGRVWAEGSVGGGATFSFSLSRQG